MGSNTTHKNIQVKPTLKKVNLEHKGNIIIPQSVSEKINYLCKTISDAEWSAVLFYKITKGSLNNFKELELELVDLYPQDIGTFVTTDFENDVDLIDMYDENEELEDCRVGSIHSHNSMAAYHSGTDLSDMEDNCQVYNVYLSVVVNNAGDKVAKIAIPLVKTTSGKSTMSYTIKDDDGKIISLNNNEEVLDKRENGVLMIDMTIKEEVETTSFPKSFLDRIKDLILKQSKVIHHVTGFANIDTFESRHPMKNNLDTKDFSSSEHNSIGYIDKKVMNSFLIHYITGNGTIYDIENHASLYRYLYRLSTNENLENHIDECDKFLMDILESFHDDGFDRAELLEKSIKELKTYNTYHSIVVKLAERLEEFRTYYFMHKNL